MKKILLVYLSFSVSQIFSQDTFSIVAVDSTTGEVGSAGASCLEAPVPPQGCLIISDVIPGLGAAHTQALWNSYNQQNVHGWMVQHVYSPQYILSEVNLADWDGDSTIRQYGIAMFDINGHPQTAAFTGTGCFNYKNHNLGTYYSVQGNILLGQQILDSIESKFLQTNGTLADKLMAALQGANIAGADTRCMSEGVPSQSSFIRVAKPTDSDTTLYLDLRVISRPFGMSPIDSLQTLFNAWKLFHQNSIDEIAKDGMKIFPNPASEIFTVRFSTNRKRELQIFDEVGNLMMNRECFTTCTIDVKTFPNGVYFLKSGNAIQKIVVQ